jgi:hypothetical protein
VSRGVRGPVSDVAAAAEVTQRPKPIHGVEPAVALRSRFWARPEDPEDSEDNDDEPAMPKFISDAMDAGFT